MTDKLLNSEQAAEVLGVSRAFLERDRWLAGQGGTSPVVPFLRVAPKVVRYRLSDLQAHLEKARVA